MAEYDPKIMQKMADTLYDDANWTAAKWTAGIGVPGFLAGAIGMAAAKDADAAFGTGLILGLIGAAFGYWIGLGKGFLLRLQAQQYLIQMQIEQNTREIKTALLSQPYATAPSERPETAGH
jgi:hypothetical protein